MFARASRRIERRGTGRPPRAGEGRGAEEGPLPPLREPVGSEPEPRRRKLNRLRCPTAFAPPRALPLLALPPRGARRGRRPRRAHGLAPLGVRETSRRFLARTTRPPRSARAANSRRRRLTPPALSPTVVAARAWRPPSRAPRGGGARRPATARGGSPPCAAAAPPPLKAAERRAARAAHSRAAAERARRQVVDGEAAPTR